MFLLNSALQSLLIQWIINIFLINIIAIYTCTGILASFFHWPMTFMLFILYLVLHYHGTLLFSQILNLFICGIFEYLCFLEVREIHKLSSLTNNNKCRSQGTVTQNKIPLKDWVLLGASNSGEVNIDSDINHLYSDNIWQCTTLPSQCEKFPQTWMWCLQYFDYWYSFEKRPGSV